jgi:hypothetical protein
MRILIASVASLFFAFAANADTLKVVGAPGAPVAKKGSELQIISHSFTISGSGTLGKPKTGPGAITIEIPRATGDYNASGAVDARDFLAWRRDKALIPEMVLTTSENGKAVQYKLSRCFVKSWSTSGDASRATTEKITISYESIKRVMG